LPRPTGGCILLSGQNQTGAHLNDLIDFLSCKPLGLPLGLSAFYLGQYNKAGTRKQPCKKYTVQYRSSPNIRVKETTTKKVGDRLIYCNYYADLLLCGLEDSSRESPRIFRPPQYYHSEKIKITTNRCQNKKDTNYFSLLLAFQSSTCLDLSF